MINDNYEAFLTLVRLGLGHKADIQTSAVDWKIVCAIANAQGLSAVVLDGLEFIVGVKENGEYKQLLPDKLVLTKWIGEVIQGYERRYELYKHAIADMAGFYSKYGIKMMILKGYACSMDWPRPAHRPCGDIDIWQFGEQKRGDALLAKEKGIIVDKGHHHHTVFYWGNFMVENHYDFVNVHVRRSSAEIEKVFKDLGKDDTYSVELYGEKVYLPSPNLHALFLMKHAVSHFTGANITLRQVLDWAFFVEKHTNEIDWEWLMDNLDHFHMIVFFHCINAICVEDLGFDANIFPEIRFMPSLKERILSDILAPSFSGAEPKNLWPRLLFKYRRWKGNAWKQEICYSESRWSSFLSGIWAKLLKPSSI